MKLGRSVFTLATVATITLSVLLTPRPLSAYEATQPPPSPGAA